jgi:hypothetical protein
MLGVGAMWEKVWKEPVSCCSSPLRKVLGCKQALADEDVLRLVSAVCVVYDGISCRAGRRGEGVGRLGVEGGAAGRGADECKMSTIPG